MSKLDGRSFRSHAERTAMTILQYWKKSRAKDGHPTLPSDFDYTMDQGGCNASVHFEWLAQKLHTIVVLTLVNREYQQIEWLSYLNEIASMDRQLFYKERFAWESDVDYETRQAALLWDESLYPKYLQVNAFEVRWKLVAVEIKTMAPRGGLITKDVLSIGEIGESHAKKRWSGFLPVAADDYGDCLNFLAKRRL